MPGILSPFKAVGRGLNGILNLGTQNALGAVGGDLNQVNPQDRASLRSNFLMSLGRGIQTGDIGGNIQQFQQGQAAPLLDFRAKQAEAARVAQEQEAAKQQQAAMQQQMQEAAAQGPEALRAFALANNNPALANAAGQAIPEAKEAEVIDPSKFVDLKGGGVGYMTTKGLVTLPAEVTNGDAFKKKYQVVGGSLFNKETEEYFSPPKDPKLMMVNGAPAQWGPTGFKTMAGEPIDPATVRSVSEPTENVQGQIFQALIEKHGGDPAKAASEFLAVTKPAQSGNNDAESAEDIADSIIAGRTSPDLRGYSRTLVGPIQAALARKGFDQRTAVLDYGAEVKNLATLNGVQMQRVRQATNFAYHSLDLVDFHSQKLSQVVDRTQFPVLNKALIAAAKGGAMGQEAQIAATELDTQIKDLQSELATVFKGGNSPTDKGLEQASEMLNSNWTEETLQAATDLARKNLAIRLQAIKETTPILSGKTEGAKGSEEPTAPKRLKFNPATGGFE